MGRRPARVFSLLLGRAEGSIVAREDEGGGSAKIGLPDNRKTISRKHARVTVSVAAAAGHGGGGGGEPASATITDTSTNGVFIDGVKVAKGQAMPLPRGAVVTLGSREPRCATGPPGTRLAAEEDSTLYSFEFDFDAGAGQGQGAAPAAAAPSRFILLDSVEVSSLHCRLIHEAASDTVYLQDGFVDDEGTATGSLNGTFVDGTKMPCGERHLLKNGSSIVVGGHGPKLPVWSCCARSHALKPHVFAFRLERCDPAAQL
jgi:pSer/pThr/pTyr-binding forkhead associated (FHA) protein